MVTASLLKQDESQSSVQFPIATVIRWNLLVIPVQAGQEYGSLRNKLQVITKENYVSKRIVQVLAKIYLWTDGLWTFQILLQGSVTWALPWSGILSIPVNSSSPFHCYNKLWYVLIQGSKAVLSLSGTGSKVLWRVIQSNKAPVIWHCRVNTMQAKGTGRLEET